MLIYYFAMWGLQNRWYIIKCDYFVFFAGKGVFFLLKCLECIIIYIIFAEEKLKFNVLKNTTMKKNNINNRKQRYNLFVEESARSLGGYMMTTEEMTRKQLEKFIVKIARQFVKSNCEKGESYKLVAETTEDAGEMLVISVEAFRATWSRAIMVNVYDFDAEDFTMWWSEKKAPKAAEDEQAEEAEEIPAEVVEYESENTTVYRHTTAEKVATIARTIAGAVGACFGSSLPVSDMAIDVNRFNKWCEGSSVADADASAPFWFAVRKQGSESGTRENCKARCKALGSPLYVLKVEREAAGLFSLSVRVSTRETAEEITAATIKRAENTADDAQAAESSAAVVPAAVDAIKAAFKRPLSIADGGAYKDK